MVNDNSYDEYLWLENAAADDTIDSPFFSSLGTLTLILSDTLKEKDEAKRKYQEIKTHYIPVEGTKKVSIKLTHPNTDISAYSAESGGEFQSNSVRVSD